VGHNGTAGELPTPGSLAIKYHEVQIQMIKEMQINSD